MDAVEDLRGRIAVTMRMQDEAAKKAARQQLSSDVIPQWGGCVERLIDGPFIGGDKPSVADIKLYMMHNWISQGVIDHIPSDLFSPYPKFAAVADGIRTHPAVVAWYAKS
jgi:glutathione S-transferase